MTQRLYSPWRFIRNWSICKWLYYVFVSQSRSDKPASAFHQPLMIDEWMPPQNPLFLATMLLIPDLIRHWRNGSYDLISAPDMVNIRPCPVFYGESEGGIVPLFSTRNYSLHNSLYPKQCVVYDQFSQSLAESSPLCGSIVLKFVPVILQRKD